MTGTLAKARADWWARYQPFDKFLDQKKFNAPDCLVDHPRKLEAPRDDAEATALGALRSEVDSALNKSREGRGHTTFRKRTGVAAELAEYLRAHSLIPDHELKLRVCHHTGAWGDDDESGKPVIAWDQKCGQALLCPHCSRIDGRRLVKRYKGHALAWFKGDLILVHEKVSEKIKTGMRAGRVREVTRKRWSRVSKPGLSNLLSKGRSIQYGVITWPNVSTGKLREYVRAFPKYFKRLLDEFPAIRGALFVLEAPLAASRDTWNLHGNAILLKQGEFDWSDFRRRWFELTRHLFPECTATSYSIEFQPLPRDVDKLDAALRELIKYPVKHIRGGKIHDDERRTDSVNAGNFLASRGPGRPAALPDVGVDRGHDDSPSEARGFASIAVPGGGAGGLDHADHDAGECAYFRAPVDGLVIFFSSLDAALSAGFLVLVFQSNAADAAVAPGLVEWSPELFSEWWQAHRDFRRTRSYGALFRIPRIEKDEAPRSVTWRGRFSFDPVHGVYEVRRAGLGAAVVLIQEDKSRWQYRGRSPPENNCDPPKQAVVEVLRPMPTCSMWPTD